MSQAYRRALLLAVPLALLVASGSVVGWTYSAALTGGVVLTTFCLLAGDRSLGRLLIAATLLSRLRVDVAGVAVIPEHAMALTVAIVGLARPSRPVARGFALVPKSAWVFVLWGVGVSAAFSPDFAASLRISGWIALSVLTACLLVGLYAGSGGWRSIVADGTVLAAVSAAFGVAMWVASSALGTTFGVQTEAITGSPAAYGLSYEANIFGGICAMWFLVDLFFVERRLRGALLVRLPLVLGVAVSFTRAAVLAMVIGVVANALLSPSGRRVARRAALPAALLVVGVLAAAPIFPQLDPLIDKASQLTDLRSQTASVRFTSWGTATQDLHPKDVVVGLGVNSFGQRHEDPTRPHESIPGYIGNVFLQLVYDSGVVGLAILGFATARLTVALRRRQAQVVALLVAGAVIGLATSPLWFGSWWVIFAAGASAAGVRRRAQIAVRRPEPAPPEAALA